MLQLPALGENQEETAWKYLGNDQEKCGAPLLLDSSPKQRRQRGLRVLGAAAQGDVWYSQHGAECLCCTLRAACLFFVQ